jgi:hypothetical protein
MCMICRTLAVTAAVPAHAAAAGGFSGEPGVQGSGLVSNPRKLFPFPL